jgi:hypothetical protein
MPSMCAGVGAALQGVLAQYKGALVQVEAAAMQQRQRHWPASAAAYVWWTTGCSSHGL